MLRTHHGSCHCQAVKFEVDLDLDAGTSRCNCSICSKKRGWGALVKPDAFRLLSGKDALSDYTFATKSGHHRFCRHCGIAVFGDGDIPEIGGAYVSVSVAALDDVTPQELAAAPVRFTNGRDNAWWNPPEVTSYL